MNIYNKAIALFSALIVCSFIGLAQEAKLPTQWTNTAMQAEVPLSEYPRPQLQRNDWLCLNGKWDYRGGKDAPNTLNPEKSVSFEGKPDQILVPYCPESVLSGVQRKQEINMWYRRSFEIPAKWQNKQVIIHFGAVDHDATVFINGKKAGSHAGGYDSFSFNITPYLKKGSNIIVVAAHDPNDGKTPSGKNGPRGDYTFSSGIWQTVWLEPVSKSYIKNIRLLPDVEGKRLKVFVNTVGTGKIKAIALNNGKEVSQVSATGDHIFICL